MCLLKYEYWCHLGAFGTHLLYVLIDQSHAQIVNALLVLAHDGLAVADQLLDVVVLVGIERERFVHFGLEAEIVLLQDLIVKVIMSILLHSGYKRP